MSNGLRVRQICARAFEHMNSIGFLTLRVAAAASSELSILADNGGSIESAWREVAEHGPLDSFI